MNIENIEHHTNANREPLIIYTTEPNADIGLQALKYQDRGWVPIPVEPGGKRPIRKEWQNSTLATSLNDFHEGNNIAVLLGDASGGLVDIDLDCPEAIIAAEHFLPKTGLIFGPASNSRSHYLYTVRECGRSKAYSLSEGCLVEYRANGSNTVFPTSVYDSGEHREFYNEGEPAVVDREALQFCVAKIAAAALLAKHWNEGSRHQLVLGLAGALARAIWTQEDILQFITAICDAANDGELRDRLDAVRTTIARFQRNEMTTGIPAIVDQLGSHIATQLCDWLRLGSVSIRGHNGGPTEDEIRLTEVGNADRFVTQHGQAVRFCHELNSWFLWCDGRWLKDHSLQTQYLAEQTARSIFEEAASIVDSRMREDVAAWAKKSCSKRVIESTLALAKPKLAISVDQFDQDAMLLNFINGTVELRTGILREHKREDWITKQVRHSYSVNAKCPRFEQFLTEVTKGDADLIGFLQRALGYSLTGSTAAQCMFIAFGEGANGKSTLLNLIHDLMGDYAMNAPVQTFVAKMSEGGASDEIARLRGARFVTAAEAEPDQPMAEALLKRVTGGDIVTARHLYEKNFDFKPQFKIWMSTNHRLKIVGNDKAIWRRIHEVPFTVSFPADKQDANLGKILRDEAPGILAWAVRGCLDWQQVGLSPPEAVLKATQSYRSEMDLVGRFLSEATARSPGTRVMKADAHQAYVEWAQSSGSDELNKADFGRRMKSSGMEDGRSGSKGHYWKDIQLLVDLPAIAETIPSFSQPAVEMEW